MLLALARLWVGLLLSAVVTAGDGELRDRATAAGVAVTAGAAPPPGVRVVDLAGAPADGRGPLPLDPAQVRTLAAGEPVTTGFAGPAHAEPGGPTRWVAVAVTLPDGSRRLVLAVRDLDGAVALLRGAAGWFLPAVLVAAAALTGAAWVATRAALRPVDRLRTAAAGLDVGDRLPVPLAADELTALAVEVNALLARRDEAVDRLRRSSSDEDAVATTVWVPVPVRAAATPAEVGLVLDNLLGNARRHARSVVHVSAVPAGRWVRLLVDDDGPGIPAADRERIFDRFTRLDATSGATGAGLGLALVARLVEGRGGTVRAGSSPDGGARLTVRWPAAP